MEAARIPLKLGTDFAAAANLVFQMAVMTFFFTCGIFLLAIIQQGRLLPTLVQKNLTKQSLIQLKGIQLQTLVVPFLLGCGFLLGFILIYLFIRLVIRRTEQIEERNRRSGRK
jgi:hypothetical protein